jgi:DDE family transposase
MDLIMINIIKAAMETSCDFIHENRLAALLDAAQALQYSNNLSLTAIGRKLAGESAIKHKIKKIDRLVGNKHLHNELGDLYKGLSDFVFTYISQDKKLPIVIDLCFLKDDKAVQMLSAEVTTKGRTLPIYREIFKAGELKNRAKFFLNNLKTYLPIARTIIVIMDAGFYEEWFKEIDANGWYWICRIRKGKKIKLKGDENWQSMDEFMPTVKLKTKVYEEVLLSKQHGRLCRIVTTRKNPKGRVVKLSRGKTTGKLGRGRYREAAKEPWVLATNLPITYKGNEIVKYYEKRMQIEESFRDIKSKQFGLAARNIRTKCIHRWGVKMLLAAIVQITYWIIGIIGHSQGMQKIFQVNTVKDRKVFSYFTLGKLIIEHDEIRKIKFSEHVLSELIQQELMHA